MKANATDACYGLCGREVQKNLEDSAKRLIEQKIDEFELPGFRCLNAHTVTPGGGKITYQGLSDLTVNRAKSIEGINVTWLEEAQTASEKTLEILLPTIFRTRGAEFLASYNPTSEVDAIDEHYGDPTRRPANCVIVDAQFYHNPFFPPELDEQRLDDLKARPNRYGHIWLGDYEPAVEGALVDHAAIQKARLTRELLDDEVQRIVVGIDPAGSSGPTSDKTGIGVAGLLERNKSAVILEDATMRGRPDQWAAEAWRQYDKWGADALVVEKNYGGEMAKNTLVSYRKRQGLPMGRVIEVTATRGKHIRFEPVAERINNGDIFFAGYFVEAERQLCQFTANGFEGTKSPDNADANDTYHVAFTKIKRKTMEVITVSEQSDVYNTDLRGVFTAHTDLLTSFNG